MKLIYRRIAFLPGFCVFFVLLTTIGVSSADLTPPLPNVTRRLLGSARGAPAGAVPTAILQSCAQLRDGERVAAGRAEQFERMLEIVGTTERRAHGGPPMRRSPGVSRAGGNGSTASRPRFRTCPPPMLIAFARLAAVPDCRSGIWACRWTHEAASFAAAPGQVGADPGEVGRVAAHLPWATHCRAPSTGGRSTALRDSWQTPAALAASSRLGWFVGNIRRGQ